MSATYRQSSRVTPLLLEKTRCRLLSRLPRRRWKRRWCAIRALAASGLLQSSHRRAIGFPPQPAGLMAGGFQRAKPAPGRTSAARICTTRLYFLATAVPYPSMATFDAPSREVCTIRRMPDHTPLQALVTLERSVYVEIAALGRANREGSGAFAARARSLRLEISSRASARGRSRWRTLIVCMSEEQTHYHDHLGTRRSWRQIRSARCRTAWTQRSRALGRWSPCAIEPRQRSDKS